MEGIAQDALIMNIDDYYVEQQIIFCFLTIGRNKI
jgi:hypothetical protein